MARSTFTDKEKIKLLNKTKKLSPKEAAQAMGISIPACYKWRKDFGIPASMETTSTTKETTAVTKLPQNTTKSSPNVVNPNMKNFKKMQKNLAQLKTYINSFEELLDKVTAA